MVPLISSYLRPGSRVLVVGCGEGRDAIFLARLGFEVVATEISEPGLARAKEYSADKELEIDFRLLDAHEPHDHLDTFDAVLMMNVLQFLDHDSMLGRIEHFKSLVRSGGVFSAQLFTVEDPVYNQLKEEGKIPEGLLSIEDPVRNYSVRYFEKGELASFFADWEKIYYHEGLIWDKPHGTQTDFHLHGIAQIIARNETR